MSQIEIITIGDELVEGRLIDSNAGTLSALLFDEGLSVSHHQSMGDDRGDIVAALQTGASRSKVVIVTGGLGPTTDDLTAECAAEAFGQSIKRFPEAIAHVEGMFKRFGRPMSPINARQADLPEGACLIDNPRGTAMGFSLDIAGTDLYFMPGVPREMLGMFKDEVLPKIRQKLPAAAPTIGVLKSFGAGESKVGQILEAMDHPLPDGVSLSIQYRASFPEIHVRFILKGPGAEEAIHPLLDAAEAQLSRYVFARGVGQCETSFAEAVLNRAQNAGVTLATAESCTGGLIGKYLTDIPGSSAHFLGGIISYANSAKVNLLGVPADILETHGAVSAPVAEAMARGAQEKLGADYAVSVTGIAGPGGGSEAKPVGTVWIGIATPDGVSCRDFRFPFDRERVRILSAYSALSLLASAMATGR